ncbi:MAG: SDR family oxidoreductase [Gammaproteobacteria bacterium]|nr:SDR family oxidoreductase [Gammaproteobacteria bacterium]
MCLARNILLSLLLALPGIAAADDPWRGKVAIITGSSSGLGYELAKIAADKDMKLVLVDINPGPSVALASRILAEGGEAVAIEVDLAEREQRSRVIETALEQYGTVDYLFNNAGYSYLATLEQMDVDMAQHLFEVNYWAYVDLANQVIPVMKAQGSGSILNVVSILAHRSAPPGTGHYAASKAALVGIFQAAAKELEPYGIKVFLASPAGMRTNIGRNAVGPLAEERRDRADDWEPPEIAAQDIFDAMLKDEVLFFPGYVEGP